MHKVVVLIVAVLACLFPALTATSGTASHESDQARLHRYADATWRSFVAMVDTPSGLPTDQLYADGHTDVQTSTTNIGAYLWSAVAAERLGIIGHGELRDPALRDGHARWRAWSATRPTASSTTGTTTATAPSSPPGRRPATPLDPILSSVDNAWLATGLRIVRNAVPELSARVGAIYDSMDFGFYYVPDKNRILFHYSPAQGTGPCCYDTVVSESRIADYIGIAKGELPRKEYYGRWRTFPATCDYSFQETRPSGFYRHVRRRQRLRRRLPVRRDPADARAGAARCSRR